MYLQPVTAEAKSVKGTFSRIMLKQTASVRTAIPEVPSAPQGLALCSRARRVRPEDN